MSSSVRNDYLILGPPNWSRKKDKTTFLVKPARHEIEIDCDARGYPRPNITWYKNDQKLDIQDGKVCVSFYLLL